MSGVHRRERGESRGIYVAIVHDLDFMPLGPHAKLCWWTLRMELGASGMAVYYPAQLVEPTGLSAFDVDAALQELCVTQWLVRERHVMWLRNALRFDPYMSLSNRLHVQAVANHLVGLPRLEIVDRFCRYYGIDRAWLTGGVPDPLPPPPANLYEWVSIPIGIQEVGVRSEDLGSRSQEVTPSSVSPKTEKESNPDDPAVWMHALWQEVLGSGRQLTLTPGRQQKYRAMYAEQLANTPDPKVAWRAVLWTVTQSEHHMSNRDYQLPESLLRSPERREKWVEKAVSTATAADRKNNRVTEIADYLKRHRA